MEHEYELERLGLNLSSPSVLTGEPVDSVQKNTSIFSTTEDATSSLRRLKMSTPYERLEAVEQDDTVSPSRFRTKSSWWLFELSASVLSWISLGTLVILLWHYNGQPLTTMNFNILTRLVALLSTITRAALMTPVAEALGQRKWNWFWVTNQRRRPKVGVYGRRLGDLVTFDKASRGALGSLELLWMFKRLNTASIGALVTILSLALSTLSQQLLSVEYRPINATDRSDAASVQRSEYYNIVRAGGIDFWNMFPDVSMMAAIHSGLLSTNQADLPVRCSTGTCTWPIVPTLGVCGGCTDVTKQIITSQETKQDTSNGTLYQLPEGPSLVINNARGVIENDPFFNVSGSSGVTYTNGTEMDLYDTRKFFVHDAVISNFAALGFQFPETIAPISQYPLGNLTAAECSLWFCIKAWQIEVVAGIQKRIITGKWSKIRPLNVTSINYGNPDLVFTDIPEDFNLAPGARFGVSYNALSAVSRGFYGISGTVTGGHLNIGHKVTNDFVEAIFENRVDLDNWIQKVALSMTNNIAQTAPAANTSLYAATALFDAPYVRVQWPWISFPIAMVLASQIVLFATIWQTRHMKTPVWKDNPLPLLFSSVDENVKQVSTAFVDEYGDLPSDSGSERLLLRKESDGWAFRRV